MEQNRTNAGSTTPETNRSAAAPLNRSAAETEVRQLLEEFADSVRSHDGDEISGVV